MLHHWYYIYCWAIIKTIAPLWSDIWFFTLSMREKKLTPNTTPWIRFLVYHCWYDVCNEIYKIEIRFMKCDIWNTYAIFRMMECGLSPLGCVLFHTCNIELTSSTVVLCLIYNHLQVKFFFFLLLLYYRSICDCM